jgi:hypothetical protein
MNSFKFLLIPVALAAVAVSADAGIFKKHPKANPAERVPALISVLKTDKNEDKREDAAEELRHFDPLAFPEIVPVLIDALQHDPKSSVRLEAAHSLAKMRPISQEVGLALEEAAAQDAALRVRLQARSLVLQYRISGYHSPKSGEPVVVKSGPKVGEPPLADGAPLAPIAVPTTTGNPAQARKTLRERLFPSSDPTPSSTLAPSNPPVLTVPPSLPRDAGPDLAPPR